MQCMRCNCDETHACEGGCFWVFTDPPLCSRCVFDAIATAASGFDENRRWYIGESLVELADRVHPENDANAAAEEDIAIDAYDNGFFDYGGPPPQPATPRLWTPGDPM